MQALGIKRGDFVGILMGNDETLADAVLRRRLIGAVTVPVNTRFKAAEIAFCLKQADVKALFYRRPLPQHRFPVVPARGGARRRPRAPRRSAAAAASRGRRRAGDPASRTKSGRLPRTRRRRPDAVLDGLAAEVKPSDLLLIQFTSGTTAYPKGVDAHPRQHAAQRLGGRACASASAPTTATSTAGRSSTSPAPRCRCWSRSSPAPAWSRCRPSRPAPRSR